MCVVVYVTIPLKNGVLIDMKVEIWSDFVSPLCYIAKRKFELALEKFEQKQYVKVEYKSYVLHAHRQCTGSTWKDRLTEMCNVPRDKVDEWIEQITAQANELNLPFYLDGFAATDTIDAHRLVKFAERKGKALELVDLLFKHFFSRNTATAGNLNDRKILVDLGKRCGLNAAEVEALLTMNKYRRAVEDDEDLASEMGIEAIPFFVFNEKYALVGNHPVEAFLEVLQETWNEDEEYFLKKANRPSATTYCEGDECEL